jgi:hypothetical protein
VTLEASEIELDCTPTRFASDDDWLPGRDGNLREQTDEHVLVLFRVGVELPRRVVRKFHGPRVRDGPEFVISLFPFLDGLDSAIKIDVF